MKKLLITVCTIAAMMIPTVAFADGQVEKAESVEAYAEMSSVDIGDDFVKELDKETGEVDGEDFEAVFGEEFPGEEKATEEVIENEDFVIVDETKDAYMVAPEFATGRILVTKEIKSLNGAESGVSYEGNTVLNYDSEESAKDGYDRLVEKYGEENVLVDTPITVCGAQGWGTAHMGLDRKVNAIKASGNARTVKVAVLDTGISRTHKIFEGKTITSDSIGFSFWGEAEDYADDYGHGTMVAGIIAESTPDNVEIMAVKVLGSKGFGTLLAALQGIQYAVENGADVINCSFSGELNETECNAYDKILKNAYDNGVTVVAGAGNYGKSMDDNYYSTSMGTKNTYPAESPYTIAVGATAINNERASFSNYGSNLDFVAPGATMKVAYYKQDNAVTYKHGTSFSTPLISAAAALIKSEKETDCNSTYEELKRCSVDLGPAGKDPEYGWGMPKFSGWIAASPTDDNNNEYQLEGEKMNDGVETPKRVMTFDPNKPKDAENDEEPEDKQIDISQERFALSYYTTTYDGTRKKPTVGKREMTGRWT